MASLRFIRSFLPTHRHIRKRKKLILMSLIAFAMVTIYANTKLDTVVIKDQRERSFSSWVRKYWLTIVPHIISSIAGKTASCDERIVVKNHRILLFKNMTIRSQLSHAKLTPTGPVDHPKEANEFYTLKKGFFTLTCNPRIESTRQKIRQLEQSWITKNWIEAVDFVNDTWLQSDEKLEFQAGYFLAIQRIEFANVYWTLIDLLDIFITTQHFEIDPEKLTILMMDTHGPSPLDSFWSVVFRNVVRPVDKFFANPKNVLLENLIWRFPRDLGPFLDQKVKSLKYIQPFRSFVLGRFGISAEPRSLNCALKRFRVLVSFRRDYRRHPGRLDIIIDRKIANELDVVKEINDAYPNFNITAVQLDALPLRTQLELIASSDIFFGMHGAAHGFTVFMPPGGVVIELFNFNTNNWHMRHIAILAGHKHIPWVNRYKQAYNKKTKSTTIPSGVPSALVKKAAQTLCPGDSQ